jgi:hypothetical protein
MSRDEGKRLVTVIPESSLNDKLSGNPRLDRAIQTRIGDQLRAMYDDLMEQPVPDRFSELLARLDDDSAEGKKT